MNIHNQGTLPFLEGNDCVEIAAVIGADGATPVPLVPTSDDQMESLMRRVKSYERYAVEAAITGEDSLAMHALHAHPLIGDARACYDELKAAHWEYLP